VKLAAGARWIFVLLAGAILFYQLEVPPVVGLADNGDFGKVIGRFDLIGRVHSTYAYADATYEFHPETHWVSGFNSSEIPLAQAAVWLNSLLSKDGNFSIGCIGAVHGALFLMALWLFAPLLADARPGLRWAMYGLILFVYCDMMYVSSLNSFYMDEPAYLFLLLTAVCYLRVLRWGRTRDAVLLIVCAFLLVTAKTQHALLGFWIALLLLLAAKALRPIRPRIWYVASGLLVVAGGLMAWKAQPADYAAFSLYGVTFETILPHSKDVPRTLADLGLDDSYRSRIGKKAYSSDSGMFDPAFHDRFTRQYSVAKLAIFYLRRPDVAYQTMRAALSEAGDQRSFGNFDRSAGMPWQSHAFAWWSTIKRHFFSRRGSVLFFAFLALSALLGFLLWLQRRSLPGGAAPAGLCLIAGAFTEMGLATLCDSMDIVRHAMIFLALFDMIALVCAYLLLRLVLGRKPNAPPHPGGGVFDDAAPSASGRT